MGHRLLLALVVLVIFSSAVYGYSREEINVTSCRGVTCTVANFNINTSATIGASPGKGDTVYTGWSNTTFPSEATIQKVRFRFRYTGQNGLDNLWEFDFRTEKYVTSYCTNTLVQCDAACDVYYEANLTEPGSVCDWTKSKLDDLNISVLNNDAGGGKTGDVTFMDMEVQYVVAPNVSDPVTADLDGVVKKEFRNSEEVNITVNVSDFEGSGDISTVRITIIDSANTARVNNASMTAGPSIEKGFIYNFTYNLSFQGPSGEWRANIYANDTNGFNGTNSTRFNVTVVPYVNVTFISPTPVNNSNMTELDILFINTSAFGEVNNIDVCLLEFDSVNESMTKNASGRSAYCDKAKRSLSLGQHSYKVYANDTNNNWNVTETRNISVNPLQFIAMLNISQLPSQIGWTCQSCVAGGKFYERLVRGFDATNIMRGVLSVSHNFTQISINTSALAALARGGGVTSATSASHSHLPGSASTTQTQSIMPISKSVIVANRTYANDLIIPSGTLLLFNSTSAVPSENWTIVNGWNDFHLIGNATFGQEIGSRAHNHTLVANGTNTSIDDAGSVIVVITSGLVALDGHVHPFPEDVTSTPSAQSSANFVTAILAQATSNTNIPERAYALFDGTPPQGWKVQSNPDSWFYNRTIIPNGTFGVTGGDESGHNHTSQILITGTTTTVVGDISALSEPASDATHKHEMNVSYTEEKATPASTTVIVAQRNAKPRVTQPQFNITNANWYLTANTTATDADLEPLEVYINWTINGIFRVQNNYTGILNGTVVNDTLNRLNASYGGVTYKPGDNITVMVWTGDTYENSTSAPNNSIIVDNIPPAITYQSPTPAEGTNTTENWTAVNATISDNLYNTSAFIDFNSSLIGYWSFENFDNLNIFDNSSYGLNAFYATQANARNITTGYYGNGFLMNRSGACTSCGLNATNATPFYFQNGLTLEAWVIVHENTTLIKYIVGKRTAWDLTSDRTNEIQFSITNQTATRDLSSNAGIDGDGKWHHIAGTWNGTTMRVYLDGNIKNSAAFGGLINLSEWRVFLGGRDGSNTGSNQTSDEVKIWSRALSAEEINASMNTAKTSGSVYSNFTELSDGVRAYRVYAIDQVGNLNISSQRRVTTDTTPPQGTYVSPTPTDGENSTNTTYTFNATVDDALLPISAVLFELDGTNYTAGTNGTGISIYANFTASSLSVDVHYYKFWLNDTLNNKNQTPRRNVTVQAAGAVTGLLIASLLNTTYNLTVPQNETFYINVTVGCQGAGNITCGTVNATARYNFTSATVPDTAIDDKFWNQTLYIVNVTMRKMRNLTRVGNLTLEPTESLSVVLMDSYGSFLYVATASSPSHLIKINLIDFKRAGNITIEKPGLGEYSFRSGVIDTNNGFLYLGSRNSQSPSGEIIKVRLSDLKVVGNITLNPGEQNLSSAVIDTENGFAYFAATAPPGIIVKINLLNFSRVGNLTLNTGEDQIMTGVIDIQNQFAYFGTISYDESNTGIVKVNLSDFTRIGNTSAAPGAPGSSVIDVDAGFAYFGTVRGGILTNDVIRINLSDFKRVGNVSIGIGELQSAAIDTVNKIAYFAWDANPLNLTKINLSDFTLIGNVELNATKIASLGISDPKAAIDVSTGFAYFGAANDDVTLVVKVKVDQVPKPRNVLERAGNLTLGTGEDNFTYQASVIDSEKGVAYFGTATSPAKIIKVNLSDFRKIATITLNAGENSLRSAAIDAKNGFAYFGTATNPGIVVKINLSDFSRVGNVTLNTNEADLRSAVIDSEKRFAYFGTFTPPAIIVKINLSDFSRLGNLTLNTGEDNLTSAVIDTASGFAYFATRTNPGKIIKINLTDFTRVGSITLNTGERTMESGVIDVTNGFAYFGGLFGNVVKINLSDFTRTDGIVLPTSIVSGAIDTQNNFIYFGSEDTPANITRLNLSDFAGNITINLNSNENFSYSGFIDIERGFAYFGTDTAPGRIIKINLRQRNPVDCGTLSQDEGATCLVNWLVRAPGPVGTQHFVDGMANSSLAGDNQSADFQVNITGITKSIALALSNALSRQIHWTIDVLPIFQQFADGNNGTNSTDYRINVSATGTTVDVYIRASGPLATPGGTALIGLPNETFSYNTTNVNVPSANNRSLTTSFSDNKIGDNLISGSGIFLKFFLNVSSGQDAGTYNNTVEIKAVEAGQAP
ncbi:MAG: LamG domain-containing protein [Candidatus Aenigmarchaeota archaeon]|nr:LamG domain-containing protein [Candidatus Aenigmarchaeota archaeon]